MNGRVGNFEIPNISKDISQNIAELGLNLESVRTHQRHVADFLSTSSSRFFKIIDTCRLDNGGIFKSPKVFSPKSPAIPIVAFVPAAGASSRYLMPMAELMESLRQADDVRIRAHVAELIASGLIDCPLPESFRKLIEIVSSGKGVVPKDLAEKVLLDIDAPKALYPAVTDGLTFLEMKRREHEAIGDIAGEVFICPPARETDFLIQAQKYSSSLPVKCVEQGPELATVRFDEAANIANDENGRPSVVPAGHGSLIRVLPSVRNDFPKARGVFIRNIDNVSGTSKEVIQETRNFLSLFRESLDCLELIRSSLETKNRNGASSAADRLLSLWGLSAAPGEDSLVKVATRIFYASPSNLKHLSSVFARPLVLMGQVPNTQRDVGGSCVFADVEGVIQKLCLELPHASLSDRKDFLEDPNKATHFNPVFVAAEIPDNQTIDKWSDHPFWLIAKKSWRGKNVFYHESILYELLGSSHFCNVIFVEVPRLVFNPHKSLFDASKRTSDHWLRR